MIENEQAVTNQETKKMKLTKSAMENQEKQQNCLQTSPISPKLLETLSNTFHDSNCPLVPKK